MDFAQGYPGTLIATLTYIMTREGMLKVIFEATADKQTPVNIVQHSYFNLAGHASGSALDHTLYINGCAAKCPPPQYKQQFASLLVGNMLGHPAPVQACASSKSDCPCKIIFA